MVEDLVLRLRGSIDAAVRGMPGLLDRVKRVATAAIAALVGVGAAMVASAKDAANFTDELVKTARAMGLTTNELLALRHAGELAGVGARQMEVAFATLQRQMGQAARNSAEAVDWLRKVGITSEDAGRPMIEVFGKALEGLRKLPQGAERTAAALALLGRSGARMETLIRGGADGIADATNNLERFGLVIDDEAAAAAEEFNDSLTRMGAMARGVSLSFGLRLLPAGVRVLHWLESVGEAIAPIAGALGKAFGRAATFAVDVFSTRLGKLALVIGSLGLLGGIVAMGSAFATWAASLPVIGGGIAAIGTFFAGLGGGTVLAIAAGVLALGFAIDDLIVYLNGGDSAFGRFEEWLKTFDSVKTVIALVKELRKNLALLEGRARLFMNPVVGPMPEDADPDSMVGPRQETMADRFSPRNIASQFISNRLALPTAGLAAALAGTNATLNQTNNINVTGVTGEQVGKEVVRAEQRAAASLASPAAR